MPQNNLTQEQLDKLTIELTKYAEEGASDDELRKFKDAYIQQISKEGGPVNFTEGSVEQQEQPTEPLEKPIVDVDRFGVPETNEYLSGARETAAKELKETEELLISADIPDLPKHVIDYPSYNVEQLDSALTDIDKRKKQTNFLLSTHGLTQPQRTEAKKQIERLEEERAAAIVYKAEKTNDYSLVGDAVQAVKDVGYSSSIGRKLRPEVYNLESRVSEDVFKEIEGVDIYDLTEIDFNGIRRADVDKVADLADKVAESIADGNPGVRQIAYERILNEAEEYEKTKKIKEKIESDTETQDIFSKYRNEALSEFESTNDDGIKYRAEIVSTVDSINNNAQSRLNKLVLDYNSDVDLYKQELISQVQQGIITNKEANNQLKDYNTQLYSELESSNNLVIENNKKDIEEVSKEYYKKIEGGFSKFLLDNPMDPSDVENLQAAMKKIYEEVDEGEFAYLKAKEGLQSLRFGGTTSLVASLGKSYYAELGRAIASKGTFFNQPWMTELGDEMMTSFSVADERVEDWSDLANAPAVVKSVGRLAGSATTSIAVGAITSAATAGLGTIPAMAAVATASGVTESIDMAGGIKRDIIRETGSLLKGEQGAEAMWKAQMGNWWTYLFDGLPYVGKALRGVSSKAAKIGIVGLESSATETVQETRQTAQEQKIMESVMSGEEISARGFGELITPGLVKSTFLEVAPGSFFLGGSTRAVTEFMMDKKADKLAKEIIVKTRAGLVDNTDSFIRQKIFASMNQFGKNFTNSWLATLQKNGAITEEELGKLYTYSKTTEGFLRNVKGLNLNEEQINTYFALSIRANELYDKAESITDDKVTRATLTEQANALKKNAQDFLNNPETGGSFVSVKIGKSPAIIMNEEQAIEFVTNNPYVVLPESKVDIVARNADEFGGILEQMAKGVEVATEAKLKDAETATQRLANRTKEQKGLFGDQHTDKKLPYGAAEISDITTTDKNGVTTATYVNPETKSVDTIITATNKGNFVGYTRVYENGKPTDMFSAKMQTSESGVFKNIITSAENTLPNNAEVVETSTISTGGLKSYNKSRLVEKVDEDGNVVTRPTRYSDATKESVKEKGEAAYKPFKTTDKSAAEAEIAKIKEAYPGINTKIIETKIPPLPPQPGKKPGKTVSNQYTISIDLPVLVKPVEMQKTTETTTEETVEKTTDTTTEGVDTTSELSEEQVSELNRILGLDESERKSQRQGRTKRDNQRLDKVGRAIGLLEQSLSEVMPNIVIYVAENSDAFAVAANEQKDRKQDRSRGYFRRVNGKYVIILNPESADVTTVFHEGLHAVLVAAGLPSTMARAVTTRMVEAVKKTATKKLQKELKEFSDLYESRLQSEEYIAELIGILANNYNEQNNETKSIIRRWLQKLAEMLGLKPKGVSLSTVGLNNTDAATIDALNFVAKKMSEGGVFTEQDLTRLTQPGEEQQGDGSEETVTRKQKAGMRMDEGQDSVKKQMPQSASKVLYNDSDVLPKPSKKKSNSQVAQDLAEVAAEYYGGNIITSNTITSKQEEEIIQVGTEEAIKAFEDSGKSAADWYSTAIEKAMAVAAVIHPSLSSKEEANKYDIFNKEKDPVKAANLAMRIALAITSQNLNVEANAKYANEQFDILKKTGKFDASREYGTKATSISSNLRLANELINKIGLNQSENFITKDFTTVELEEAASEALGKKVKISGLRNDLVNGAALFGPKIGQGFLQNLMGKFEPVTIDLWLRRTWGRWTGDVVGVGVTEERMARLLNGISEAKKDTGFDIPDFMRKHKVIKKTRPSSGSSYSTMSDSFTNELEDNDEFRNDISIFAKALTAKANTMYKLIKNEPMSKELYRDFMSGKKTYGQTANELQLIKDKTSDKYKDYASKEKAKGLTPIKKSEWVNTQNKKEGRDVFPNNKAISSRKPEWVKASTTIINDLKPIDIPSNQDRKVITRVVKEIKNRMEKQGYSVTNADVQALLWYPEKDIWSKLRGEEESNLKQSYDEQFIKIAEKQGLGKEAKAAAEGIKSRRTTQPGGTDGRTTDVKVSRPVAKKETVTRKQKRAADVIKKGDEVQTGKPLKIQYNKNPKKAPAMASEFGQDVEASGDYVTQKVSDFTPEGFETGVVESKKPLVIDITDDTQILYKNELSQKYDGKVGEKLSEAIRQDGYDAIVTKYDDGSTGEIVLLKGQRDAEETVTRKQKRRTKPESKVKDAFEFGIQKGVPAIAIKNHLIKLGYTEEEITSGAYDAEKIWNKDGKKVKNWFELARRSALSARKFRPQSMFLAQEAMESSISAELRQAKMMADNLNRAINRYKSQDKRDELIDAVDEFMRDAEERDFWRNELPDDIAQIAEAMRVHIDSLSLKLVDSGVIKAESSRENILGNIGVYMNRSYQVFDNKNWKEEVSDQVITAAQNHLREAYYNSLSGISELDQQLKDGKITESEYNRRKNRILSNKASVKEIMDRDNVSEDEALTMHVEKVVDDILTRKDVDEYISFAKSVVGKKDLSSLKRRKDIPPAIRALMGEYTDPGYNYAMSIFKIANLVENQKYLTKIRDAGLGVWLFEDEAGIKKREGYKQITFDGDASMNPLDGLYAPEAVADAFNDKELSKIISGIPVIGTPYKTYLKFVGGVKYSKTILSFGTHAKNVIGNMYFMAQNGYLDPREYQQPFMTLVKQFAGKELTAEQEAKMNEWIRAGIIGQGASIGEIKAIFEGEDSFEKALSKRIDKKTDNILSKGVKVKNWVGKKAQEAYQYEDDMFKIVAYEKEKLNYSKILFDGKSYNKLDAAQQSTVNNYVAEIIKNILPNYGRIGGFGKFLKAVPVAGTFISFQLEAYRTAYNTVALAMQEIKGDIPGVSEAGKKLAQKRGAMRLASIVGFQAFKYGIIALLGVPLIPGDDDDEDGLSEKIRMLLPFWDTNSDIAIQDVKPNGNFTYVSISASDPYGSIFKVVNATKNYTKTGEGFSKIFGELAGPFVSEDILLNTLRNVSNNENDYGGKIWRKTDTEFEVSKKISFELYKAFEPGSITSTRKIAESENKLNDIIGQFTGFKVHEIKSLEQAGFKFRDIQNEAQESKKAYNSVKYNIDDYETQSDIDKVIRTSKKAMDEDYQEAVKLYQALISLGVSDRDIKKKMYDSGISATMRSQISRNSVDVKLNPIKK